MNNWDLAINKWFTLTERTRLEFRVELFNTWNHAQFLQFDNTMQEIGFGTRTGARPPRIVQFALSCFIEAVGPADVK